DEQPRKVDAERVADTRRRARRRVRDARGIEVESARLVVRYARAPGAAQHESSAKVGRLPGVVAVVERLADDIPREDLGSYANRIGVDARPVENDVDLRRDRVAEECDAWIERRAGGDPRLRESRDSRARLDVGTQERARALAAPTDRRDHHD